MANEYVMHLRAKGSEVALARLKSDMLSHCTVMCEHDNTVPIPSAVDYQVDLAAWNRKREDWAEDRLPWWLELRRGQSELLPIENQELRAVAGSRRAPAIHFLDGLRELYTDVQISGHAIDLSGESAEEWKCSPEGTFCVEEVFPCWEGEIVWYWKKDGKLMIGDRKPVAEELLGFAGNPFVLVDGVPLSITVGAAKEHVWKLVEKHPYLLERVVHAWPHPYAEKHPCGLPVDDDRIASAEDHFFLELNKLHLARMVQKEASWYQLPEAIRNQSLDVLGHQYPWLAHECQRQKTVSAKS